MDISADLILPILPLDAIARAVLLDKVSGVSVGSNTRIHLLDDSPVNQDTANAVLDNFGNLTVNADKITMIEGDADPVITCSDPNIATDTNVNYLVLLDGDNFAEGTAPIIVGEVTLNLISPVAGIYDIYIYRTVGSYACGSITIMVSEV